ncbi:MAG TPA: DUF507 family protein [Polyangiaceae bacterium]
MRLHSAKLPQLSRDILEALISTKAIETESPEEVRLDIESVLSQYLHDEQQITERAKEVLSTRGLPPTELARIRRLVAEERKIQIGDEAIDYILDQLVEILMHSASVDEVWSEDFELRRQMREPLRKHAALDDQLQTEVRGRLKHVQEGTALWEVEYRRMMEDMKRRKGL